MGRVSKSRNVYNWQTLWIETALFLEGFQVLPKNTRKVLCVCQVWCQLVTWFGNTRYNNDLLKYQLHLCSHYLMVNGRTMVYLLKMFTPHNLTWKCNLNSRLHNFTLTRSVRHFNSVYTTECARWINPHMQHIFNYFCSNSSDWNGFFYIKHEVRPVATQRNIQ
jgi:hypothetical protein